MIYLDYAANSPVEDEVLNVFYDTAKKYYGNPNSMHEMGKLSKDIIDESTNKIADLLNIEKDEIIYTSGATESNNLVIKGICERYKNYGKHVILSSLEHTSLIAPCAIMQESGFEVELAPVNKDGLVDVDTLKSMIRKDTILVSVCSVDSEIGIVQPIEEIGRILKDYPNTFFHTDASQSIGKVDIDFSNVDLITIAPHKFGGINDIGILVKKKNVSLKPIINGGRSTTVYRSGTPNTASIVAASKALELALINQKDRYNYVSTLNNKIISFLSSYSFIHINNTDKSIPFTINFSVVGIKAKDIVSILNQNKVYVSSKTSCCPLDSPSKLVYALTRDKSLANSSVRISLSNKTTMDEVEEFSIIFDKCMKELINDGKISRN